MRRGVTNLLSYSILGLSQQRASCHIRLVVPKGLGMDPGDGVCEASEEVSEFAKSTPLKEGEVERIRQMEGSVCCGVLWVDLRRNWVGSKSSFGSFVVCAACLLYRASSSARNLSRASCAIALVGTHTEFGWENEPNRDRGLLWASSEPVTRRIIWGSSPLISSSSFCRTERLGPALLR
jgi:hypothetical protein